MAGNLPLRLTYEHARHIADALRAWETSIRAALVEKCGYEPSVIDQELALLFAQRAQAFGLDLLGPGATVIPMSVEIPPKNGAR